MCNISTDPVKPVGVVSAGKPEIFSKVFEKPAQSYALVPDNKMVQLAVFSRSDGRNQDYLLNIWVKSNLCRNFE